MPHYSSMSFNTETVIIYKWFELISKKDIGEKHAHCPLWCLVHYKSFKLLGTDISEDITWTQNMQQIVKKAQQKLFFLRKLRKFRLSPKLLSNVYRCTVENILTDHLSVLLKLYHSGQKQSLAGHQNSIHLLELLSCHYRTFTTPASQREHKTSSRTALIHSTHCSHLRPGWCYRNVKARIRGKIQLLPTIHQAAESALTEHPHWVFALILCMCP